MSLSYDEAFEIINRHVAEWEGGVSDDAGDPGGLTKYGICLEFLKDLGDEGDLNEDGVVNRKDVMVVTHQRATELFKKHFWEDPGVERFPPHVAMVFYDSAVNSGVGQTNKLLQRALGVDDDGDVGPETLSASESCDDQATAARMCDYREKFYRTLAARRPALGKFLKGWLNRVNACRKVVASC